MALTDAQSLDVRRFLGYGSINYGDIDRVYSVLIWRGMSTVTLTAKLANLSPAEEAVVVSYLTILTALEQAIVDAGGDLDTLSAGPWKANPNEIAQRTSLFNQKRRDLAGFLGFIPGPAIGGGLGIQLIRA